MEDTYRTHPEIDDEEIEGPVFVIGLPRTGTTALSQLVAADPQFRSLRLWESSDPCPATRVGDRAHRSPHRATTEAGLAMMNEMFPLMADDAPRGGDDGRPSARTCSGMSFRTMHFDGFGHVPSYLAWVTDCDMRDTYRYHRRVLRLLQWHCPPRLWHLKTPVHMFASGRLAGGVSRRQVPVEPPRPGEGAGVGLQPDPLRAELGQRPRRLAWSSARSSWGAGRRRSTRAMDFRGRVGEDRFADLAFADLQSDPVGALASRLRADRDRLPRPVPRGGDAVGRVATSRGRTASTPTTWRDFGLDADQVHERFARYMDSYDAAV